MKNIKLLHNTVVKSDVFFFLITINLFTDTPSSSHTSALIFVSDFIVYKVIKSDVFYFIKTN